MSVAEGPTKSRGAVLVVMCAGYFLVLLDVTIVNVALPRIGSGLGAGVSGLQWVVDGYALALATLMLAGGTLGDLHGHKRLVLAGLGIFGIASLGCGLAPSVAVLVGFRVLQGAGAALMLPGTLAVIIHAYPERRERARAIGIWAGVGSAALPAGPLLGGALTQLLGWRAVFFVAIPIAVAAGVVAARLVHETAEPSGRRFDAAGVGLGGAMLAAVTFAFIGAGHEGVGLATILAATAAVGLLGAFIAAERARSQPMLPVELFRRPAFSAANAIAGAMNLATLGLLFVLTLYLQDIRDLSALRAGLALLPLFVPLGIIAPLAGRLTARAGSRAPAAAGLLAAAGGFGLLTALGPHTPYTDLLPALLLWGIGLGLLTPAIVAAAVGAVPRERAGLASAVNNTARQASGAVGIAAFGAIAGAPQAGGFIGGLHTAALRGPGLYLVCAGLCALLRAE